MDAAALAPEFPAGLDWLNTTAPLRMSQLLGRVTALAFVNGGSAWCNQTLVDLDHLRNRHPDRLNVVAVNVPRFDHEREPRRAGKRFARHRFEFPVAHDADWVLWQHYGIEAWPTVVLLDARGRVRERFVGDGQLREIDAAISRLQAEGAPRALNAERIEMRRGGEPQLPLCFPVGLALSGNYLYVADSGHHRVLECDLSGRVLRQFGSGGSGFIDGPMELAAFNRPQGLAIERDTLYIADTGNHAVRRVQLRSGDIDTVVGAGRPGTPTEGLVADPRMVALDQPRAVAASLAASSLFIATAGDNRVWRFDLGTREIALVAGSGELAVTDGVGPQAAFAEPASLATVQQAVYVCDAAGSAIRSANARSGQVTTLVGADAWTHGNADGARTEARLQQPQAIALDQTSPVLWIADSGNDCLRALRLGGGEVTTVPLPQRLHAPCGLAAADGVVWIADTDAHAVLRHDTRDGSLKHVPIGE
ncbi:redoxin family protein [Luteimonas sp. MC1895]|uniref:redoxin family protein n=1 Tax=Luteimonas sp. MC1895 TaxID=2819513 RepID=UPI0018F0F457|nr:redoxin family protein [Luteimonas sp. MC1895]MBJ6978117.1 redoxin family protein [Luteimonas sp. MC1895]